MKPINSLTPKLQTSIPLFLAPAFAELSVNSNIITRSFSSSSCHQLRKKRDLNKRRGESVLRSTGPRHQLSVERLYRQLPVPQAEEDRPLQDFPTNPNHGLYGFFNRERQTVIPGEKEALHGRAWTVHELTFKSFEDLHALYWLGLKEINRVNTRLLEHKRLKLGYGSMEVQQRIQTVEKTLKNIKYVLRTRQDAYDEAKILQESFGSAEKLEQWNRDEQQKLHEQSWEKMQAEEEKRLSSRSPGSISSSVPTAGSTIPSGGSSVPSGESSIPNEPPVEAYKIPVTRN